MFDIILFMAPAICMCIILVGICGYVGIHVVMREVIFIDIALAQIAALGTSFGLIWGFEISDISTFIISLVFTFLAAVLLSLTRKLSSRVPQEAFIGILYATGASAVLLAGDRLPHGNEHVHDLMCGHLLWVNWSEVLLYLIIYLVLGIIYFLIHKKLITISQSIRSGKKLNNSFILWDFIFYSLLGLLVTFAVREAGVLLVFGFLIVPAVIGILLGKSFHNRLIIGWISGVIVSLIGSYISYKLDFPTGATVVVCLGFTLLIVAFIKGFYLKYR
jgi:zinc/manganese transport system permease protein